MKKIILILLLGIFMISFSSAFDWTDGNLISYYKLDDNLATTNVIDSEGVDAGTASNTTNNLFAADGIINSNFNFDGTENVLDVAFPSYDDFSISLWFRQPNIATNSYSYNAEEPSGEALLQLITISSEMNLRMRDNVNGGFTALSSATLSSNTWYHVVATFEQSTGDMKLYINATTPTTDTFGGGSFSDINAGALASSVLSASNLTGDLDEVGIWNRTLTSEEVTELYNSGDGLPFGEQPSNEITVVLDLPLNNTLQSSNVLFNFTLTLQGASGFNLTNATISIWDSDGDLFFTNTTLITGNESNSTFFIVTNLTIDNYEWNVFGSSENATGFLLANFSEFNNTFTWVPFEIDNEVFNLDVFETSRQDFLLNITTLPSVLSVNAILNYNNTRFTADVSCVLGFCQISTAIDIPLIPNGEEQNKSFLWEISVFDGTNSFSTNLTANEQNVTRIHLQECGDITTQTLNFTVFDEQTEDSIDPFSFDASLQFWLGTGSVKRNNTLSNSSISSIQLCFSPATETLFLDATIQYDEATGANYTQRNYFFQNDEINNVSQDIKLGLLLAEDSTSFILKVQDRDILPVANVLIFTERFYPGEGVFKIVQVSETDDNGRTVGFFETETVEYRFILKQNGETVLTTNKQKIVGESVPFTLTFTIGEDEGASWEPFEEIDDLESSILFNKTSNIVSFTYLDTSGDFELGRLIVEKVNASGLQNTVICSETSVQSSATITCNITGNSTGQYIARGIITRNGTAQLVEQTSFSIEDFSTISGRLGLFLGWFIILISIFTFKFNEVAGIILVNLAIIFVNLIGLISFGYVFISAMIAISIIILVVLER